MGPFQMIVLHSVSSFWKSSSDLGPMSRPIHPSGTPSSTVTTLVLA